MSGLPVKSIDSPAGINHRALFEWADECQIIYRSYKLYKNISIYNSILVYDCKKNNYQINSTKKRFKHVTKD